MHPLFIQQAKFSAQAFTPSAADCFATDSSQVQPNVAFAAESGVSHG